MRKVSAKETSIALLCVGVCLIGASVLLRDQHYTLNLLMVGLWFSIFGGILLVRTRAKTRTPALTIPQHEQLTSNMRMLIGS